MTVPKIFLSHSSRDAEIARALKGVLATHTAGEIEWWLSSDGQSIRGVKNWRAEVEDALRSCKLVFILFTMNARASAWVQYEAGFADALGKDIIPVALPGFDADQIPGPLQHKQGFNLRGHSGLSNILKLANQILNRHDLLSFGDSDYDKIFMPSSHPDGLSQILDSHIESVDLKFSSPETVIDELGEEAEKLFACELTITKSASGKVVAGPGFMLTETSQAKPTEGRKLNLPDIPPVELQYVIRAEVSADTFLELLPVFTAPEITKFIPNGYITKWSLRRGSFILTRQSDILARMRGTSLRWISERACESEFIKFEPDSCNANALSLYETITRSITKDRGPEPYRPSDMRYSFQLDWKSACLSAAIGKFLNLLIDRAVITFQSDVG